MNHLLVEIYLPQAKKFFDVYVPDFISTGELKYVFVSMIEKHLNKQIFLDENYCICEYDSGTILDDNKFLYEIGIKNGTKLLII